MPRERSPNRAKAYEMWAESGKKRLLKDIAAELGVSEEQVRKWKCTDKWDAGNKVTLPNTKSNVTKRKGGGQPGNKNARGHGAPAGNKNAEKHGLFSKYLPEETLELIKDIETISPLDILWDQIMIQYAAIIRSQRIMHVVDKDEMIKEVKRYKSKTSERSTAKTQSSTTETETEWNFQFAWDRQATFLTAQSRAMAELRNMIRQYDELLNANRDLVTEEQKLRIQRLKTEISILKGEGQNDGQEGIDNFIKATTMPADEIKAMFEGDNDEDVQEEN